jgi:hypothetical protein
MMWYGFSTKRYTNRPCLIRKKYHKLSKRYSRPFNFALQLSRQNFRVLKPFGWTLLILRHKNLYTKNLISFSDTYFVKLPLPSTQANLSFDLNTGILKLNTLYRNNSYRLFFTVLKNTLKLFYCPLFLKLKFKGKGYYIYKNKRSTITPQFGYAHRLYLYSYFVSVKFLSKTSIMLFGLNTQDLSTISFGIKKMRPINIFTGRGVRFSRQIIYKKVGKVSSYR